MKKNIVIHIFAEGDHTVDYTDIDLEKGSTVITSAGLGIVTEIIPDRNIIIVNDLEDIDFSKNRLTDIRYLDENAK